MLINPEDAVRMLRSDWAGPVGAEMLSQELYAIFTENSPSASNAPATFSTTGQTAPLAVQVPTLTENFPAIDFVGPQGQQLGSITIANGVPQLQNSSGQSVGGGGGGGGGRAGFGTIQGGSGAGPYTIEFAANEGIGGQSSVSAFPTQSGTNAIPTGTGVMVFQLADGTFKFVANTWL